MRAGAARRACAFALAATLLLTLLPACGGNQKYYWNNRGGDLVDILRGHVMFGKALGVQVEATRFLSLGWTEEQNVWSAGLYDRALGTWHETISTWGLLFGRHDERQVVGIPRVSGSYGWVFKNHPEFNFVNTKRFWDWFTFRATAAVFLGVDIEVRCGEAIDFVVGIFTWDPSEDDRH